MKRLKSIGLGVLVVLVVVAVLAGVKASQIKAMIDAGESFEPPPLPVSTAEAEKTRWSRTLSAVGTVVAIQDVVIASEVPGTLIALPFESGDDVERGALIARLDTSTERADLMSAEAAAELAVLNRDRNRSLREQSAIAQASVDEAESQAKQAAAAVASLRALIAKKTIRAPFAGRLGIREANLGQILSAGTPIVSLQSLDPIYVEFTLPEQSAALIDVGQPVEARFDVFPGEVWEGVVEVVDASVSRDTRALRVRALVQNDARKLRPGMFADVRVLIPGDREVVTLPNTAILYAPYGDSVYTVDVQGRDGDGPAMGTASQVFVRTGERRGDFVEIVSGVEAGQAVVSAGAFRLQNGAKVVVENELAPQPELAPEPGNE